MCHAVMVLYTLGFFGSIVFVILMTLHRHAIAVHVHDSQLSKHWSVRTIVVLVLFTVCGHLA